MASCDGFPTKNDLIIAKQSIDHISHVAKSRDSENNQADSVTDPIGDGNFTNLTLDGLEKLYYEAISKAGYILIDSFNIGATLTLPNQVLRWAIADGGNGEYYRWDGMFPKTVPAGSTPATSGGVALGAWVGVGDASLRAAMASSNGANLSKFTPYSGPERFLQDYLREGYIRVASRDELVAAQTIIKTIIHKRTEIRLSRNFAPWTAPQTDIDLAYVTIVGEADGVVIDATGIPNVAGNYWIRAYNSGTAETLINGLPFLDGFRLKGVNVRGPSRSSNTTGLFWHSPEGALGNISWAGVQIQEFGKGVSYGQNAYIIKAFGCYILRCNTYCVGMDSGYANSGENISFFGCTLGVSAGPAIYNANGNGGFDFHGTSVDYAGQVAVVDAGYVTFTGGHHEQENTANPATGPWYVAGPAATSRISCNGVKQVCFRGAGSLQNYFVQTNATGDGVYFTNCMSQNMRTATGIINTGGGVFRQTGTQVQSGGGNIQTSVKQTNLQSLVLDGTSETATVYDWYIRRVNNAVTSRTSGDNITLSNSTDFALVGNQSLKVTKSTASTNHGIALIAPITRDGQCHYDFSIRPGASGISGDVFTDSYFVALGGYDQFGRPIFSKISSTLGSRTTVLTGSVVWQPVQSFASKAVVPVWATHIMVDINSSGLGIGSYYIDSYGVWEI
jgi:hypothetical protein